MDSVQAVNEIIEYVTKVHDEHMDGCKWSCNRREVGFFYDKYDESYWFCRFGGYCIGNLGRWEEVKTKTLEDLLPAVKARVEASLKEHEEMWSDK